VVGGGRDGRSSGGIGKRERKCLSVILFFWNVPSANEHLSQGGKFGALYLPFPSHNALIFTTRMCGRAMLKPYSTETVKTRTRETKRMMTVHKSRRYCHLGLWKEEQTRKKVRALEKMGVTGGMTWHSAKNKCEVRSSGKTTIPRNT